jgi:hypothetical protein
MLAIRANRGRCSLLKSFLQAETGDYYRNGTLENSLGLEYYEMDSWSIDPVNKGLRPGE